MSDTGFTRGLLRDARTEAKRLSVVIPRGLHAHRVTTGGNLWYEVRDVTGVMHWDGSASDAFEARANAISAMCQPSSGPRPECSRCVYSMGYGCEDPDNAPGNSDAACHN